MHFLISTSVRMLAPMRRVVATVAVVVVLVAVCAGLAARQTFVAATARLARARSLLPPARDAANRTWCLAPFLAAHTDLWFNEGTLTQVRPYLRGGAALPEALEPELTSLRAGLPVFFGCAVPERVGLDEGRRLSGITLVAVVIRDELNRGETLNAEKMCLQSLQWAPVLGRTVELHLLQSYIEGLSLPCRVAFERLGPRPERTQALRAVMTELRESAAAQAGQLYASAVLTEFRRLEFFENDLAPTYFVEFRADAKRFAEVERVWNAFREAPTEAEREQWSDSFDVLMHNAPRNESLTQRWRATEQLCVSLESLEK